MGSFCGSGSQTVVNTSSNPNVTAQQNTIYGVVNGITDQYAQNPSSLVAPWNSIQTAATQGLADQATANLPWNYLGQGLVGTGAEMAATAPSFYNQSLTQLGQSTPITAQAWNPSAYMSPYTQNVIDTTMANINRTNAIQQNGALGNAISQGNAFGGDRAGIAMGELARNQALASNQTLAQLQQADFNQASQQANAQQQYGLNVGLAQNAQQLQLANAYSGLGNNMIQSGLAQGNLGQQTASLGNQGQSGALSGLGALFNAGSALQQTQQQQVSAPLTLAQWMATNSPGTGATPTSTTYPGASPAATLAGLGLTGIAGAGMLSNLGAFAGLLNTGGRVNKQDGGSVGGSGHDLVDRYHQIVKAFQSGGQANPQPNPNVPGGIQVYNDPVSGNVPLSKDAATTLDYNKRQGARLQEIAQTGHPLMQQLALDRMPAQHLQLGGEVDPMTGGKGIPGLGMSNANLLKMGMAGLRPQRSPTVAPQAPHAGGDPQDILKLASGLGGMAGLGYQAGGEVDPMSAGDDVDPMSAGSAGMGDISKLIPRMNAGLGDLPPQARGFDPYRYMDKPAPGSYAAAQASPWMAALAAGLGILGKAGARDGHGLPISGAAAIGQGAQAGFDVMKQQVEQQQKQREVALHARQIEAQWQQHQQQMRQQAAIALGMVPDQSGQLRPTLQSQKQTEDTRRANLPHWDDKAGGRDFYGNPRGAWVQPNAAPPEVQFNPNGSAAPTPAGSAPSPPSAPIGGPPSNSQPRTAPGVYVPPENISNQDATLEFMQGKEFLNELQKAHPAEANVVKGILRGDIAPSDPRVRGMQGQKYLSWATQADPTFTALNWPVRMQTAKSFAAGGKDAQKVASAGMLIGHLNKLDEMVDTLGNWNNVPFGNAARHYITNPLGQQINQNTSSAFKQFDSQRHLVADELTKLLAGASGGTLEDRMKHAAAFDPSLASGTLHDVIRNTIDQMEQRLLESANQWNQAYPNNQKAPIDFLAPEHQKVLHELKARLASHGKEGGPAAPAVGEVRKGYKFKGGDPSKSESWEKAS